MRKEVKITSHPTVRMLAYGLDHLPEPGYFLSAFGDPTEDGEDNLLWDMDTRAHMSLSGSAPVHRLAIAKRMNEFIEVSKADVEAVRMDEPVGE